MSAKQERRLDYLPEFGAGLADWRDWLTDALSPADGFRIYDFLRHGRGRGDTCELVVLVPGGNHRRFEIEEQRLLSSSASLRATIVGATDGLVRPESLTKAELEDIWTALVTISTVRANQSKADEARDWIQDAERAADLIEGYTLKQPGRIDALLALDRRVTFDRTQALRLTDPNIDPRNKNRPALLIDSQTGEKWMRVGEVTTYLRIVLGVPSMDQSKIEGRLSPVGVRRAHFAAQRRSTNDWARANLYRLPVDAEEAGVEAEETPE